MSPKVISAAIGILLISLFGYEANAANNAGSQCAKAGQSVTVNGQKLVCSLIWVASGVKSSPTPTKTTSNSLQSKSFRLETITFNEEFGSAGATARVTNISSNTKTATLTITIFKGDGKTVAVSMMGVVSSAGPGQTVTVNFISVSGDLPSGQFKYAFQVDAEF